MNSKLAIALLAVSSFATELVVLPAYQRTGPDGEVLAVDKTEARPWALTAARASYASFQVVVKTNGPYTLRAEPPAGVEIDVYREWYHFVDRRKSHFPDALIPVKVPYRSQVPAPDNRIPDQRAQAFWVDVWIAKEARPGTYEITFHSESATARVPLKVLGAITPNEDVVTIDHNSYGTSWLKGDALFPQIHAYHRMFYEHRGIFHQLGYGHAGKVAPEFAPELTGSGRNKHIASWDVFDRHYGPLLDGSAFAKTRRGTQPIPFVYLPINPEWPASFLWWGEPGYEAEFTNVVSEMEKHFREKGWTRTHFEVFFNHKKRYKGFSWDGDEVRFPKDNQYFVTYAMLLKKAVPAGSPVMFTPRADVSWSIEDQSHALAGVIKLWVCGGGTMSWYPQVAADLKKRGDTVWFYGGTPPVTEPAAKITEFPLQAWIWGIDGFVHWLAVGAGNDPWFHFDGGGTALVYPGERFGISGPIPSIRLKLQRDAVQDLALLDSYKTRRPIDPLRAAAAREFNGSTPADWWNPLPALANRSPLEWTNADIGDATRKTHEMLRRTKSDSWQRVHDLLMKLAEESK